MRYLGFHATNNASLAEQSCSSSTRTSKTRCNKWRRRLVIWSRKEKSTSELLDYILPPHTQSGYRGLVMRLAWLHSHKMSQGLMMFFFFSSRLVIETLEPLPKDRKCFRMVNGVLVERTINDVLPALKTNSDGLKQVLEEMLKQYKTKQSELDNWKVRLHLRKFDYGNTETPGDTDLVGFTEKEQHSGRAAVDGPLIRLYYHICDFLLQLYESHFGHQDRYGVYGSPELKRIIKHCKAFLVFRGTIFLYFGKSRGSRE